MSYNHPYPPYNEKGIKLMQTRVPAWFISLFLIVTFTLVCFGITAALVRLVK